MDNKSIILRPECMSLESMSFIEPLDIRFLHIDESKVTKDALPTWIKSPSGNYHRYSMQITNKQLQTKVLDCLGGFGPVRLRIVHIKHYGAIDGPSVWLVEFCADRILACRYALMTEESFKRVCGPWRYMELN